MLMRGTEQVSTAQKTSNLCDIFNKKSLYFRTNLFRSLMHPLISELSMSSLNEALTLKKDFLPSELIAVLDTIHSTAGVGMKKEGSYVDD